MSNEWDNYEGIDAAEKIIRAALGANASEVHLTSDTDGASVYLVSPERIEFFIYLSVMCRDKVLRFFRDRAGIDQWRPAPATGFGLFEDKERGYQIEVCLSAGFSSDDAIIKISGE